MTSKLELETVDLKVQERVAWITLNRPESLNAFTPQMGRELTVWCSIGSSEDRGRSRARAEAAPGRGLLVRRRPEAGGVLGRDGGTDLLTPLREVFHPLILRLRTLGEAGDRSG